MLDKELFIVQVLSRMETFHHGYLYTVPTEIYLIFTCRLWKPTMYYSLPKSEMAAYHQQS